MEPQCGLISTNFEMTFTTLTGDQVSTSELVSGLVNWSGARSCHKPSDWPPQYQARYAISQTNSRELLTVNTPSRNPLKKSFPSENETKTKTPIKTQNKTLATSLGPSSPTPFHPQGCVLNDMQRPPCATGVHSIFPSSNQDSSQISPNPLSSTP